METAESLAERLLWIHTAVMPVTAAAHFPVRTVRKWIGQLPMPPAMRPKIWESFARFAEAKGRKLLLRRYQSYLEHPDQPDTLFYGGNQMIAVTSQQPVDGGLALANMELLVHAMGLGALYCGFATRAIENDPELRAYFGVTETRHLDSCLIVGHTDLRFHRTAPRNPPRVEWR